ncbi:hypothetical protein Scep_027923 [Stephania cephalantha]|uniref:Uncharacterized protein n=1 Tax=Stephania cephalantha TaxID=152367 RepID=A0AAP0E8Z4_9MAGN
MEKHNIDAPHLMILRALASGTYGVGSTSRLEVTDFIVAEDFGRGSLLSCFLLVFLGL